MNGHELKKIRRINRLSQKQWADIVGVGRVAVSDWERGASPLPVAAGIIAALINDNPELLIKIEQIRGLRP